MDRQTLIGILVALLLISSAVYIRYYRACASVPCFGTEHTLFEDNLTLTDLAARIGKGVEA